MRNRAHPIPVDYQPFSVNDKVILTPRYQLALHSGAPVWGSRFGYIVGTVTKTRTGFHDKSLHTCMISWPTGAQSELSNLVLDKATTSHLYLASQWDKGETTLPGTGAYILVREAGEFYLGYLDFNEQPHKNEPYHVHFSCQPIMNIVQSDYNLMNLFMSQEDFMSVCGSSPAACMEVYRKENGFQLPANLLCVDSATLPRFASIRAAAETLPPEETRDGILLFSTPVHPHDVADMGPPAVEPASFTESPPEGGPDEIDEAVMLPLRHHHH